MGIIVAYNAQISINLSIVSSLDPIVGITLPDGSSDPLIDRIPFHEVSDNQYLGFHTFDNVGMHHLVHKDLGIDHILEVSENCGVTEFDLCFLKD